jgi:hypothetical protein
VRQFAPGAHGRDELGDVARVAQRPSGSGLDPAQPVADGVGVAEELRAGGGGGAAGPDPGLEGAEQQVKLILWHREQPAKHQACRLQGGVRRRRDEDVDRTVTELGHTGAPGMAAQCQPRELERPACLVQLAEHRARTNPARRVPVQHGKHDLVPRPVGQGEHAKRQLRVEPPHRPDVNDGEGRFGTRHRIVAWFRLRGYYQEGAVQRQPQGTGHLPQRSLGDGTGEDHLDHRGPLPFPRAQDLPGLVPIRRERGVAVGVLHREDNAREVNDVTGGDAWQAARGSDQR